LLRYEDLKPEEKEALAAMNSEVASWVQEERDEYQAMVDGIYTLEQFLADVERIKKEMRIRMDYGHLLPPDVRTKD
jgi:hypothetical protein